MYVFIDCIDFSEITHLIYWHKLFVRTKIIKNNKQIDEPTSSYVNKI